MPNPIRLLAEARAHAGAGRFMEAALACESALAARPNNADALGFYGAVLLRLGRPAEAEQRLRAALSVNPRAGVFAANLGVALEKQGQFVEAVEYYTRAVASDPRSAPWRLMLGNALRGAGRLDEAAAAYREALALQPGFIEAQGNLALTLNFARKLTESLEAYREAVRLRPADPRILAEAGDAAGRVGLIEEALSYYDRLASARPGDPSTLSKQASLLNYVDDAAPVEVFAAHRRAGAAYERTPPITGAHANDRSPGRRLRIGYLSPDMRGHSVAYFFEPVLGAHRRDAFEVFCYAEVPHPDATTERIRAAADRFVTTVGLSDRQLAEAIIADGVDILVDLAGFMVGHRLGVMALRPAPVQVTWIGYPNTTGLTRVDHRIVDAATDPPGVDTDRLATERLLRLEGCFLCYGPPKDDVPDVSPPPALASGSVTFGSFNYFPKISGACARLWSAVLDAVPGSTLLLKSISLDGDPPSVARLRSAFEACGVDPARVLVSPFTPTRRDHLAEYGRVDIALDTFPYHGTTTTCEAMLMGVPTVTLAGGVHASRVGVSLLSAAGLPAWIAGTPERFVQIAANAAADIGALAELRRTLRGRLLASPLCDAPAFTARLESRLRDVWREWCASGGRSLNA